jgi:hypothetical protein
MPYRSKTKLRKAVTNHSPNRLSRPPSPASPLFDNVGLLVVFFVRLPWTMNLTNATNPDMDQVGGASAPFRTWPRRELR